MFIFITPVEVTPGTADSWENVDVSSYVPSGSTGVMLHIVNTDITKHAIGLRKNGSTDDRTDVIGLLHCWALIGVDANRVFEAYIGDTSKIDIYLVGYTDSNVTFFTNAYDKTPAGYGWQDMDVSSECPNAVGVIMETTESAGQLRGCGARKNGSTDDRDMSSASHYCFGIIIGCDGSQITEVRCTTNRKYYVVGYVTGNDVVFNTNAIDISLASVAGYTWQDLPAVQHRSPAGAFIEVILDPGPEHSYGLRKDGSSEDIKKSVWLHAWATVETSIREVEGYIGDTDIDFFLVGYPTKSPTPRNVVANFQIPAMV